MKFLAAFTISFIIFPSLDFATVLKCFLGAVVNPSGVFFGKAVLIH